VLCDQPCQLELVRQKQRVGVGSFDRFHLDPGFVGGQREHEPPRASAAERDEHAVPRYHVHPLGHRVGVEGAVERARRLDRDFGVKRQR
jgi:hypothetical protein